MAESPREKLLDGAKEAVMKQRNNTYGPPTQDFDKVAKMATTLGFSFDGKPLESHHTALFQMLVKLSRLSWSPGHEDSWMDVAGYASCGFECATQEAESPKWYRSNLGSYWHAKGDLGAVVNKTFDVWGETVGGEIQAYINMDWENNLAYSPVPEDEVLKVFKSHPTSFEDREEPPF